MPTRALQILIGGAFTLAICGAQTAPTSYFDSFHSLGGWYASGDGSTYNNLSGCVLKGPGANVFCTGLIELDATNGRVTLSGVVQKGTRYGSEIRLTAFQPGTEGTYAARVRFSQLVNSSKNDQASVRAFFTYSHPTTSPCIHMEHDFELLAGSSRVYSQQWNINLKGDAKGPGDILTTTHDREGYCASQPPSQEPNVDPLASIANVLGGDDFVTLVVTVQCTSPGCSDSWYKADYWMVGSTGTTLYFGSTTTPHPGITNLPAFFNVWWIQPPAGKRQPSANMAAQTMEIDWFYWNAQPLSPQDAISRAGICDKNGAQGVNACQ